jgi:hypothetical protein
MNDSNWNLRFEAMRNIRNETVLADIARNCPYHEIRREAVRLINNEDLIIEFARNDPYWDVRRTAIAKVYDNDVLADIARTDSDWDVLQIALQHISDADMLRNLLLENFGYFPVTSFTAFERNFDRMIYESMGTGSYEDILDMSDESVLIDFLHERLFGDFRVMVTQRLTSSDVLRNLALNDLDYRVRREAVRNPNLHDEKTFADVIKSDHNDAVRLEALRQIDDRNILEDVTNDLNPLMRLHAFERVGKDFDSNKRYAALDDIDLNSIGTIEDENMLYTLANEGPSASVRKHAFEKITDEHILADLVCHSREFMNRALNKITDKALLLNIALYCTDKDAKRKAIKKIDDEELLLNVVQSNPYNDISAYIIDRIRDESNLEIIAFNNSNPFNRKTAVKKIQNQDILVRLGEVECEEMVCTAIVRKCHDRDLLEYIGLSNPCKTVRRHVGSVTDDDELLYKFALKEREYDNRREMISRMTDEKYIIDLLKREDVDRVFRADFNIEDDALLIDLAKNAVSEAAMEYALRKIKDESILLDFIYASPFTSKEPENKTLWEGLQYNRDEKELCLSIMVRENFTNMKVIEDFLIENEIHSHRHLYPLRNKVCEIPSIYRIVLNCKSKAVRERFKPKLEYERKDEREDEDDAYSALAALFG